MTFSIFLPVTDSIVDYLGKHDQVSHMEHRKELAKENGIEDYSGTAVQNLRLLGILRELNDESPSSIDLELGTEKEVEVNGKKVIISIKEVGADKAVEETVEEEKAE